MSSVRPKLKPEALKVVTAWDVRSGRTVWRTAEGEWSYSLARAQILSGDAANAAFEQAKSAQTVIVEPYLMEVTEDGAPAGRETLRESIRANGPTMRTVSARHEVHW